MKSGQAGRAWLWSASAVTSFETSEPLDTRSRLPHDRWVARKGAESQKKTPAPYDKLARMIHDAIELLETAGTIEKPQLSRRHAPYNGYCARAGSAYQYLAKHDPRARKLSDNREMSLKRLKRPGSAYGDSHYWLEDDEGRVLDLIFEERKRLSRSIDYGAGKGASVLRDRLDKRLPAKKETQRIIAVVQTALK